MHAILYVKVGMSRWACQGGHVKVGMSRWACPAMHHQYDLWGMVGRSWMGDDGQGATGAHCQRNVFKNWVRGDKSGPYVLPPPYVPILNSQGACVERRGWQFTSIGAGTADGMIENRLWGNNELEEDDMLKVQLEGVDSFKYVKKKNILVDCTS